MNDTKNKKRLLSEISPLIEKTMVIYLEEF